MERLNVLLIEPSRLSREGLRLILRDPPYVIEDAPSAENYLGLQHARSPDLVIWGLGVSATFLKPNIAALRARFANAIEPVRHVVLANAPTASALRRLAALDVDALLLDDISSEVLQRSLELVMLGQRLFPVVRRRLRDAPQAEVLAFPIAPRRFQGDPSPAPSHQVVLSSRESQILQHLVDGASNKAIARSLQITEATVKVHVKGLLRKVRATNRTQVAIWALHNQYRVIAEVDMPARGTG